MSFDDDELILALLRFSSDNEAVAREAARIVFGFGTSYLRAHLRKLAVPWNDIDEIIQRTLVRLWDTRKKYTHKSIPAFRNYLKLLAKHARADLHRENPVHKTLDEAIGKQPPRWDTDEGLVNLRDAIVLTGGNVWFGYKPKLTLPQREQRVVAAQTHFLHNGTLEESMLMAGAKPDPKTFRQWICEPAVALDVAYRALNLSGDDLVRHLLCIEPEGDLLVVYQEAVRDKDRWQTAAVFWKYCDGDLPATIKAKVKKLRGAEFDEPELIEFLARCDAKLPFLTITEMLCERFSHDFDSILSRSGLWKRLVFNLWYLGGVPQNDIHERLDKAGTSVGHPIPLSLLNSWIGNGVLRRDLGGGLADLGWNL